MATLRDDSDLHDAGLTSFGTVDLMASLKDEFGVECPEDLVGRARFISIDAIGDTLRLIAARRRRPPPFTMLATGALIRDGGRVTMR